MSSFNCEKCGAAIIDSPDGYVTGCKHYPTDLQQENARLRDGLESIEGSINGDIYDDRLHYIKEIATEALKKGEDDGKSEKNNRFYLVTEQLDLLIMIYSQQRSDGHKMGTSGV